MAKAEEYRVKAAELNALAKQELDPLRRAEYANLARAYVRLSEQADKNAGTDIVYETSPQYDQPQQQQQPQSQTKQTE